MHTVRDRAAEDRGATIILVAAAMFLIMGIAALVVDFGLGLSERRQDQNIADVSVMGGALSALQDSSINDGALEVRTLVETNLDNGFSAAQWQTAWENCADPDALAFTILPNIDCISWQTADDAWTLRVKVPDQDVDTTFAKVLGFTTLTTNAAAEATMELVEGGDILPFALFAGPDTESCLKDSSGPALPPPCDGPATGQFGPFDPYKFAPGMGFCSSTNNVFVYSVGRGIDHPLSTFGNYTVGDTEAIEGCSAGEPDSVSPNTVDQSPGNKIPLLGRGLLYGDTLFGVSFPGRLASAGSPTIIREGGSDPDVPINNQPIWNYFISGSACDTAVAAAGPDPADKKTAAVACIDAWAGGFLFDLGFINAQRIAFVPVYDEPVALPSGRYHINDLLPVYLESTLYQDGGSFNTHSPGAGAGNTDGSLKA